MEPSLGQQLKHARDQRGLSLADVAHATKVPQARLQHLEEDNLAAFGNLAYARSFARIYSRYLGVNIDQWVKSLPGPVFAGAHDYRYLTSSFGPWVEPLRKRVRVSIHRPTIGGGRRRWHALMLFVIIAIGTIMLGNQFLTISRNVRALHELPPAAAPASGPTRSADVRHPAPVPVNQPKLISFASQAGKPESVPVPLAPPIFDQGRQGAADPAAKP